MKLTAKLILIVFLAVAALTCASGYFTASLQLMSFQQGRQEMVQELRREVEERLTKAWRQNGRTGLEAAMATMNPQISRTRMRWVSFNVAPEHPDSPNAPSNSLQRVTRGEVQSVVVRSAGDDGWLRTYLPVLMNDSQPGAVEISDSLQPLNRQNRFTLWSTLATLAGLGFVCLGVVFIAGLRLVGRPLEELINKTKQIGRGDFSQPLQVRGRDELAALGVALNEMCDHLREQKERIESETASRIQVLTQLRHADRLKTVGRLAAGIAHELGTPLNVVAGRAGLIADGKLSAEEIRQSAATIKGEAQRITNIVRQLMDFARRTTLQRRPTDLRAVVSRTTDLLRPLAESKGVRIEHRQSDEPLVATVDEPQIQQVLTNIIMNAIQSISLRGTVTVSACRCTKRPPELSESDAVECALIEIVDDGSGIPAENLGQLFEPFFTTKDVGSGTGLGLSISYGIVQEHGGWIDVESKLGSGSRFSIYIPREVKP
jgi:signal transduction histidine kinase